MTYDYGDMARESARRDYERRLLREWGKDDDPPSHAVELAEGRRAAKTLMVVRQALDVLHSVRKREDVL